MVCDHVLQLRCEPIPHVRIGLIGLGNRGMKTLMRYADIAGASIVSLTDLNPENLERANEELNKSGRARAKCFIGKEAWREACADTETDLVYICTEWSSHCKIAVEAMKCGKHVAVEVPAATSVEECHLLVETAERTRRHCFMTENCCYDHFSLATLEMQKQNFFGRITHCEGAYIHNLRQYYGTPDDKLTWMEQQYALHTGNSYPTHAIGPIGWLLGLHRGDRMDYLVSLTSEGGVNSTLIKTLKGVSIVLQLDVKTPRPYSRIQTVCGTNGYAQKYPLPTIFSDSTDEHLTGDDALRFAEKFMQSSAAHLWNEGKARRVANEMNYAMDSRLIYCLQNGQPLDIDVYDAAEWSCLVELSARSAKNGSIPVKIPDFTKGRYNLLEGFEFSK